MYLDLCTFPKFDHNRTVLGNTAYVFSGPSQYDIILGCDFCAKMGITLCFDQMTMTWFGLMIPIKESQAHSEANLLIYDAEGIDKDNLNDAFAADILPNQPGAP